MTKYYLYSSPEMPLKWPEHLTLFVIIAGGQQLRNCTRMSENGLFIPIPRVDGTCVGIGMQFVNYYID